MPHPNKTLSFESPPKFLPDSSFSRSSMMLAATTTSTALRRRLLLLSSSRGFPAAATTATVNNHHRRSIHIEKKLTTLGIELPPAPMPKANYNIMCIPPGENVMYLSGHLPIKVSAATAFVFGGKSFLDFKNIYMSKYTRLE